MTKKLDLNLKGLDKALFLAKPSQAFWDKRKKNKWGYDEVGQLTARDMIEAVIPYLRELYKSKEWYDWLLECGFSEEEAWNFGTFLTFLEEKL